MLSGTAVRIPVWHYFLDFFFLFHFCFSFAFVFTLYSFLIRTSSQKLLNQTDVVIDEELEKVITIYISTDTDIGGSASGYEYPSGETTETSSETEACLHLDFECILFRMLKFS